jgi:hypothetical protein
MALARTREALHNGWDKNDPKDAQVILHMLLRDKQDERGASIWMRMSPDA